MIELAELPSCGRAFRHALFACGGQRGNAAIGWIDDDRAARDAVDANDLVTRVEPEAVVAADRAAGRLGNLLDERLFARRRERDFAAHRRWRRVGVAGLVAEFLHELGALFERGRLLLGQRHAAFLHPFEGRLGFVAPVALQVGFSVRRARHDPGFGGARRLGRRLRARPAQTGSPRDPAPERVRQRAKDICVASVLCFSWSSSSAPASAFAFILVGLEPTNKKWAVLSLAIECFVLSATR